MHIVLDTGVIIEYIIEKSILREFLKKIFLLAMKGKIKIYLSTISLAEVYYISKRIYIKVGIKNPEEASLSFLNFLKNYKGIYIVPPNFEIAIEAGKIKSIHGLSLGDCFVFATSKILNAKAVFRNEETEFKPILKEIKNKYGFITIKEVFNMLSK